MINTNNQNNTKESILYNNILLLSRNELLYTKFNLSDTFQNRIHLIFIHISFLFAKIKLSNSEQKYKAFSQKLFDFIFRQVEINMREVGYGDVSVNKNMKSLIKSFYNILLYCEKYKNKTNESKNNFFLKYLKFNNAKKTPNNEVISKYFNKFETFCFVLKDDSVLQGKINFNYN